MKNNKITLNEHRKLGALLKILDEKLNENFKLSKYKTKKEALNSHEWKAMKLLSKFKSEMEEIMLKDYPQFINTDIYYGGLEH